MIYLVKTELSTVTCRHEKGGKKLILHLQKTIHLLMFSRHVISRHVLETYHIVYNWNELPGDG